MFNLFLKFNSSKGLNRLLPMVMQVLPNQLQVALKLQRQVRVQTLRKLVQLAEVVLRLLRRRQQMVMLHHLRHKEVEVLELLRRVIMDKVLRHRQTLVLRRMDKVLRRQLTLVLRRMEVQKLRKVKVQQLPLVIL